MPPSFKVIIIGSGLAGSLLANGLIHNDVEVMVYERLPQNARREGYQIRLGAPALEGFRTCLTANQIAALIQKFGRANGAKSGAPICYDQHFNELLDLAKFPSYSKSAPINRQVLRHALAEPISVAGKLRYGKSFKRYEIVDARSTQELVRVWFDDGSSEDCDLLIGADGSHSKVNQQLGLKNIQQITSHIIAVAKSELPTAKYVTMTPQLSRSPVMTFAGNKALYFCAYLPDKYDDSGSARAADFDDSLSSSMFAVTVPVDICPPELLQMKTEEKWNFISFTFREWAKEYHEIIEVVKDSDVYMYKARISTRPPKDWRRNVRNNATVELGHPRVWLLGDAIHPMLPSRGMGGNQAMRDTATLLPLLLELSEAARTGKPCTTSDIARACKSYEDEMIPRAFGWVKKSGGNRPIPVDTNTWIGKVFFFIAAQVLRLARFWYLVTSFVTTKKQVDDAPEFRT